MKQKRRRIQKELADLLVDTSSFFDNVEFKEDSPRDSYSPNYLTMTHESSKTKYHSGGMKRSISEQSPASADHMDKL